MNGMTYLRIERFWDFQNADAWKKALAAKKSESRHPQWCKLVVRRDFQMDMLPPLTRLVYFELLRLATQHANVIPNDSEWIAKQISIDPEHVVSACGQLRTGRWIKETRSSRPSRELLESFATRKRKRNNPLTPFERTPRTAAPTSLGGDVADVNEAAARWLHGHGWDESFDQDAIVEELDRLARRPHAEGTLDRQAALVLWRQLRMERHGLREVS